jgi:hypothetical protein
MTIQTMDGVMDGTCLDSGSISRVCYHHLTQTRMDEHKLKRWTDECHPTEPGYYWVVTDYISHPFVYFLKVNIHSQWHSGIGSIREFLPVGPVPSRADG